ncbi:MAG TPA: hypothetical protein VGE96_06790 [Steroidobacteraceae bacterium]
MFLLAIAVSLVFAPAPGAVWRALAGLGTACLLWQPVRVVILQRGPSAVRRLSWAPQGSWSIVLRDGSLRQVSLHPSSAALGPWLMLTWTASPALFARRWHALIDARSVSPVTFRALRGRLKTDRSGVRERRGPSASRLN